MQFATLLFVLPFCFSGVQAELPLDQIIGGLNNFRDLATNMQSTADSISPIFRKSNAALLQTCADGWSQALQGGTQFVAYIEGTPQTSDAAQATAIYTAFNDCATAHKKLLKTLSAVSAAAGLVSAPGSQLATTMVGIHQVIDSLTAKLTVILGPGPTADKLSKSRSGLVASVDRAQSCYAGKTIPCIIAGYLGN